MSTVHMLQPTSGGRELFAPSCRGLVAEPSLAELMRDPITLAVMAADRVDRCELSSLLRQVSQNLR